VTLSGRLPDGMPLEAKAVLGEDGHCPVYLPLYGGRGALLGWCQWDPQKNPPLTGQLAWFRPASPKDKLLPAGAAGLLIVCGQRAEPSRPGRPAWTAPQAVLAFTGGQLPETLGSVLEWDERGRPRFALAAYEKMEFRLDPEHGLFEGAFTHPTTRKSTVFQGVWLPQMGWGSGYFVDGETIGLVSLTPATNALPAAAEAAAGQAPAPSRPKSK
jgi:hypothetical protein